MSSHMKDSPSGNDLLCSDTKRLSYSDPITASGNGSKYLISREHFISSTSSKDRSILRKELCLAILFFLELDKPVYLHGLGILLPKINTKPTSHTYNNKVIVRKETIKTITFEKCYDLIAYYRNKYPDIVETKDLTRRIYPRLPLYMQIQWTERLLGAYVRGLIRSICDEIIVDGCSKQLAPIGDFFALHNRQGENMEDWFAGADIFLNPNYSAALYVGKPSVFERPRLHSAWELLEAAYGPPLGTFAVDVTKELTELGYDTSTFEDVTTAKEQRIPIAVFPGPSQGSAVTKTLIYCTEGLRTFTLEHASPSALGNEFVFQLAADPQQNARHPEQAFDQFPLWPARPITMAWILMHSTKSKYVKPGLGLSCNHFLAKDQSCNLTAIFTSIFALAKTPQLSSEGSFSYTNIVGITKDEAKVAEVYSPQYLLTLLKFRNYDQVTRLNRSSVVTKTGILASSTQEGFELVQP
ncbi:suppressor of fused domain protein [Oligoflexia bacterium]|nr:suppressor of fused domain protein [Oligoflexia bacterium]